MKVELCAVISLDGYIARVDRGMDWTSREDKAWFGQHARDVGAIITGKTTYDERKSIGFMPVASRGVLTHHPDADPPPNTFFAGSPQAILTTMEQRGAELVILAGGGKTNTAFAQAGLIDEMYLDVEPVILGDGIPLFPSLQSELRLRLIDSRRLNTQGTTLFHYEVIK